jgi:hypothetical protein
MLLEILTDDFAASDADSDVEEAAPESKPAPSQHLSSDPVPPQKSASEPVPPQQLSSESPPPQQSDIQPNKSTRPPRLRRSLSIWNSFGAGHYARVHCARLLFFL